MDPMRNSNDLSIHHQIEDAYPDYDWARAMDERFPHSYAVLRAVELVATQEAIQKSKSSLRDRDELVSEFADRIWSSPSAGEAFDVFHYLDECDHGPDECEWLNNPWKKVK